MMLLAAGDDRLLAAAAVMSLLPLVTTIGLTLAVVDYPRSRRQASIAHRR